MQNEERQQPEQPDQAQSAETIPSSETESAAPSKKRPHTAAIAAIFIIALAAFAWVFLTCHHPEWTGATCTEPKTCTKCGLEKGAPLGHEWKKATCTEPKTCEVCGAIEGSSLGHDFGEWSKNVSIDAIKAVTLNSRKCSRCEKTEQAEGDKITSFIENERFILSPWSFNKRFEKKLGITSDCDDGKDILSFGYSDDSGFIGMVSFTSMDGQKNLGAEYKYDATCNPSPILFIDTENPKYNLADLSTAFVMACDPSLEYKNAFAVVEALANNTVGNSSSTAHNGIEYLLSGQGSIILIRAVVA